MLKSIKLHRVGPVPDLSASFGDRLNVITGDNGLGKSFLLDVCFWSLTGTWPGGRMAIPDGNHKAPTISYDIQSKTKPATRTAKFDFKSQSWSRQRGRPPMPGLVIYAAVDGSFAVWDPARNYWRGPGAGKNEGPRVGKSPEDDVSSESQSRAYHFGSGSLANGLMEDDRTLCNGLIRDWVNWQYQRSQGPLSVRVRPTSVGQPYQPSLPNQRSRGTLANPFELLGSVVKALSHPEEPMEPGTPRRVFVDDTRTFPTIDVPYGNVAFPHWAAGIKRVLSFAYLLVWSLTEHAQAAELRREKPTDRIVLIVDEIEAHLHPKWQRTILPAVLDVAERISPGIAVQFLVATHSPLVLASVEPFFDEERDSLVLFELAEQAKEVSLRKLAWAKQGDAVGWRISSSETTARNGGDPHANRDHRGSSSQPARVDPPAIAR